MAEREAPWSEWKPKREKWCRHFMRDQCEYGDKCGFVHPGPREYKAWVISTMEADRRAFKKGNRVCRFLLENKCTFGDKCGYWHPADDDPYWGATAKQEPEDDGGQEQEEQQEQRGPVPPPVPRRKGGKGSKGSGGWWMPREASSSSSKCAYDEDDPCAKARKLMRQMSNKEIKALRMDADEELNRRDEEGA